MKTLHLIGSLDYSGAASQIGILAKHLPAAHTMHICCLGKGGPWVNRLRQHGRRVDCLSWTRTFDPTPLWNLCQMLKAEGPDLIHVWGLPALHSLGLVGRRWLPRTIVSQPLPTKPKDLRRLDRWLLRRVRAVVASSRAEAMLCRELGVTDGRSVVVPPSVELPANPPQPQTSCNGPSTAPKQIVCIGALEARTGFRDALWAFDMLHHAFHDMRLAIVGDGPQRDYLAWFAAAIKVDGNVMFQPSCADVHQPLTAADVCWSPTIAGNGRQVVLEAMAAGRPVVAADRPGLHELITEGQTGFIVPPGDKVAVCKRTRSLFLDADMAMSIGEAARAHVAANFSAQQCAERWSDQYAAAA